MDDIYTHLLRESAERVLEALATGRQASIDAAQAAYDELQRCIEAERRKAGC